LAPDDRGTGAALIASVIGGLSGYGSGALMPLVLVPILGPAPIVPIIALSSIVSNAGRTTAFHHLIDMRRKPSAACSSCWRVRSRPACSAPGKMRQSARPQPAI
jgi:hypothetical protein